MSATLSWWGIFSAAGAIVCFLGVAGYLGNDWWFFDLASHFRPQYTAFLAVYVVVSAVRRIRFQAAVYAAFAAINIIPIIPFYIAPEGRDADVKYYRGLLANVNTANRRFDLVDDMISTYDPDILVLEEISSAWIDGLSEIHRYEHKVQRPRDDNFGIALYSKYPMDFVDIRYFGDAGVPSIYAVIRDDNLVISVVATHPPPPIGAANTQASHSQLEDLADFAASVPFPKLILGDLNNTPWSPTFRRFLRRAQMNNSARGFGIQCTWPTFCKPMMIPIDHCLHSPDIVILNREVGPHVGSDHLPIIVDFGIR